MSRRAPIAPLLLASLLLVALLNLAACGDSSTEEQATADSHAVAISGRVEAGLRVLTVDASASEATNFTVYRGDYIRIESATGTPVTIVIADLKVDKTYPVAEGEKAYFKVPNTGTFAYTTGNLTGQIEAIEFAASGYQEVSAEEGAALIKNIDPIILDVRTPGEFAEGHLIDAKLIPVQVLQAEIGQLGDNKDKPIFVYCRSGNRSTVAAKVLMDQGFSHVVNMRKGIREWQGKNLPMTK